MKTSALETALTKAIRSVVNEEVKAQLTPLKQEIARLERAIKASGRPVPGGAKAGPKTGTRTAASEKLGQKAIKAIRKKLGLSQADFAKLTGVTPVAVYFWESGRTKPRGASVDALVEVRAMSPAAARKRVGRA